MAVHTIQIVVIDGGKEGSYKANNATRQADIETENKQDYKDTALYKVLNFKETIYKKLEQKTSPTMAYALKQSMDIGLQTAKSVFNYYVSDIGRSTGDSNYQARVNRTLEIGSNIVGFVNSIWSGATIGLSVTGNPIGAVIGAVAGFASSAINYQFQQAEKQREYNYTMAEEKAARDYTIGRMTGGTGVRLR